MAELGEGADFTSPQQTLREDGKRKRSLKKNDINKQREIDAATIEPRFTSKPKPFGPRMKIPENFGR